jgi:hypothetical protein
MKGITPSGLADARKAAKKAINELFRACDLHPDFPDVFVAFPDPESVKEELLMIRMQNDSGSATGYAIFYEEFLEMIEAVYSGNLEAARLECIQAMAMLLRVYLHLPTYCEPEQTGGHP